jgi:ketosteroid isomerase-like protein
MSKENEVRKASKQFYAGLNQMVNGDADPLSDIWSHGADVKAMHPIGGREVGWNAVRESFEQVARLASDGKGELKDQIIHVVGDAAYEVGVEHGQLKLAGEPVTIEHRVTNIYRREGGAWKMIHHHTDTSPEMMGAISRYQERPLKAVKNR